MAAVTLTAAFLAALPKILGWVAGLGVLGGGSKLLDEWSAGRTHTANKKMLQTQIAATKELEEKKLAFSRAARAEERSEQARLKQEGKKAAQKGAAKQKEAATENFVMQLLMSLMGQQGVWGPESATAGVAPQQAMGGGGAPGVAEQLAMLSPPVQQDVLTRAGGPPMSTSEGFRRMGADPRTLLEEQSEEAFV